MKITNAEVADTVAPADLAVIGTLPQCSVAMVNLVYPPRLILVPAHLIVLYLISALSSGIRWQSLGPRKCIIISSTGISVP